MTNRWQPFDCSIAGKTVDIGLRHGGGRQEPATVYVRCDQRDCQYVDMNAAPCPLRVEMFADGTDHRLAEYLTAHAGERHCYACLIEQLDITHEQVRRASWRLKDAGFSIRPMCCAACHRRRVTIGSRPGGAPDSIIAAVASNGAAMSALDTDETDVGNVFARTLQRRLRDSPGFAFCAHCLARELQLVPSVVRDAMRRLESHVELRMRAEQCVSCLITKRVIRHEGRATEGETPRRVVALLVASAGLAYCASCVAFAADVALADAKRVIGSLGAAPYLQGKGSCAACGRWLATIGFVGNDGASR